MRRREQRWPDNPDELERKADRWFKIQEEMLRTIVRIAVQYHAELSRDDPAHKGRLSQLKGRLRERVHDYGEARQMLREIRDKQLRAAKRR